METGLQERLRRDLVKALKSREKLRVSTLRLLLSEIKNAEIANRGELSEEELLDVVTREAKRRRESIDEFRKGNRIDLVEKESAELRILEGYLPEQLSEDELRSTIADVIKEVDASTVKDLGKVMGRLMPLIRGKADGKRANEMVREMLGGA